MEVNEDLQPCADLHEETTAVKPGVLPLHSILHLVCPAAPPALRTHPTALVDTDFKPNVTRIQFAWTKGSHIQETTTQRPAERGPSHMHKRYVRTDDDDLLECCQSPSDHNRHCRRGPAD